MTEQRNTSDGTRTGSDVAGGGAGDANAPPPVVTQADRDAAAEEILWRGMPDWVANAIRECNRDNHRTVQAFARHRIAEQERCAQICQTRGAKALAAVIRRGQ